ncbi:CapA family protein, partial [Turicimonas muris]
TVPHPADVERTIREIKEAKRQADIVLVSVHAHEFLDLDMDKPAEFLRTFSRKCIDAGASVVIGHGPHELRGIEKYGDGLIFYSLGNFIFQTETIERQPVEAYTNMGMPSNSQVGDLMDKRSGNGTRGFAAQKTIWSAVLPVWETEDGKITSVTLHPIDLHQHAPRSRKGSPILTDSEEVLHQLKKLSKEFGTEIQIKNGKGYIDMTAEA